MTYGYPQVHAELRSLGVHCSRMRIARLMRKAGIQGCIRSRRKRSTRRDKRATPAPDLVGRNFAAAAPNKIWTTDITYVHTQKGFLYLAFILDVYSRKVVGWAMASHLRTKLVVDALEMALWRQEARCWTDSPRRPRSTVHGALIRQEIGGGWDSPFYGKGGIGFGQRPL
jgi:putative transposase